MDANGEEQDATAGKKYKMALCLWISICVVGFVWFVSKVLKGRRQIRYNFDTIEQQLKRIQSTIEARDAEEVKGDKKED